MARLWRGTAIAVTSIVERTWSGMPKLSSTALFKPQLTAAAAVATGCVVGALVAYLLQPYFMSVRGAHRR